MDDRVPELRDSHASSSREPSLEPTPTRSVVLGKHSVYTHFPEEKDSGERKSHSKIEADDEFSLAVQRKDS